MMIKTILCRRSIRRFREEQVKEAELRQILQAGLYAPSAGGRQGVLAVVCQNREVNERLGKTKRGNARPKMAEGAAFVSREQPSIADDPEIKNAFYDAPAVITLFGPKNFLFAKEDAAMAAENMMLAAEALGVGSCYIGAGWEAFDSPYGQEILREWNIPGNLFAIAQVVLGYPMEEKHPAPKPRKEGRVLRV